MAARANRSFNTMLLPAREAVPGWAKAVEPKTFSLRSDNKPKGVSDSRPKTVDLVRLDKIFSVRSGISVDDKVRAEFRATAEFAPYLRPSKTQTTSFVEFVNTAAVHASHVYPRHTLYVSTNGQGSHTYTYVSTETFVPNSDVSVLLPDRSMSLQEKLYYAAVVTANRPRFSYGRKPKGERLDSLLVPKWAPEFIYVDDLTEAVAHDIPQ